MAPPARAILRATGPATRTVPLRPTKQRGRYQATLRFPFAGSWRLAVTVGRRTTRLGSVAVDVPRDPLVQDPITIAAEPTGSLVVGQLQAAPVLRIAHARASKIADGPGVFHVYVAGGTIYAAGRDGVVYRLDGSTLTPLTPPMDASAVAVDGAGNLYVAIYVGLDQEGRPRRHGHDGRRQRHRGLQRRRRPCHLRAALPPALGRDRQGRRAVHRRHREPADPSRRPLERADLDPRRRRRHHRLARGGARRQHLLGGRRAGRRRRWRSRALPPAATRPGSCAPPTRTASQSRRRRRLREPVGGEADPAADLRGQARAGRPRVAAL